MQKQLISQWCKNKRKNEGLNQTQFCKMYNFSRPILSKIENGTYDKPTPFIASNMCFYFGIEPEDFIDMFILSDSCDFDDKLFLESILVYYNGNTFNLSKNLNRIAAFINGFLIDNVYKDVNDKKNYFSKIDGVFKKDNDFICCKIFNYRKNHHDKPLWELYDDFGLFFVSSNCFYNYLFFDNRSFKMKNYLCVFASKEAFDFFCKTKFQNCYPKEGEEEVNFIFLLLPKHNTNDYLYFVKLGSDFIGDKEHLWKI